MGTLTKMLSSRGESMKSQVEAKTGEAVIAAGRLRQGRTPSMTAMVTGAALFEVMRARRSKTLPRSFVLAVTAHPVVVRKEAGSWPREGVTAAIPAGEQDGTLRLAGESIAINRPNLVDDPETNALPAR